MFAIEIELRELHIGMVGRLVPSAAGTRRLWANEGKRDVKNITSGLDPNPRCGQVAVDTGERSRVIKHSVKTARASRLRPGLEERAGET